MNSLLELESIRRINMALYGIKVAQWGWGWAGEVAQW
jgi:hypothetical protein